MEITSERSKDHSSIITSNTSERSKDHSSVLAEIQFMTEKSDDEQHTNIKSTSDIEQSSGSVKPIENINKVNIPDIVQQNLNNKQTYSKEKLNITLLEDIKILAKQLKIPLSEKGKLFNKNDLIDKILKKNNLNL